MERIPVDVRHCDTLRIALECHTCFEWLMPAADAFRARWPDVEVDLVTGYQSDPVALLHEGRADIALVNNLEPQPGTEFFHLLRYRLMAILANDHPLAQKKVLEAEDFRDAMLVTYPIPEDALTIVRQVLKPAAIPFTRRTMALTLAIVMLVSGSRGIAVLPRWVVQTYLQRKYVSARPITEPGLTAEVWAATRTEDCDKPHLLAFMTLVRETSTTHLADIV
ncbi:MULTISPECIES: LysR substrate-binding domain-containing protein [unclassified Achromobacter]|uniref:LysR substrate-binding domain-containing protein n=1 Tax=unclassified Achromobacter TaxID=2626865 RepID=UPI000B519436|nr:MULTISPECIES: LysR substrate-binding domain-containing protein [unclassified Achromobacter]OWT75899.1 transcriptional regulator [Achromobacter sp. HZ28]OWT76750.1 transcriptional regulator [Achromobacter sp. HZ34]